MSGYSESFCLFVSIRRAFFGTDHRRVFARGSDCGVCSVALSSAAKPAGKTKHMQRSKSNRRRYRLVCLRSGPGGKCCRNLEAGKVINCGMEFFKVLAESHSFIQSVKQLLSLNVHVVPYTVLRVMSELGLEE